MVSAKRLVIRFWSLIAAAMISLVTVLAGFSAESVTGEAPHAVTWVWGLYALALGGTCMNIVVPVHAWRVQRIYAKGKWQQVFWADLLLLPLLTIVVSGLHNIPVATFDFSIEHDRFEMLNSCTGQAKDALIWLIPLDVCLSLILGMVALISRDSSKNAIKHL